MKTNRLSLVCAFVLSASVLFGQKKELIVRMKNGSFPSERNIRHSFIDSFNKRALRFKGKTLAVLQFDNLPSAREKALLAQHGIELLNYLPDNAYVTSISGELDPSVLLSVRVASLVELKPEQKMEARMSRGQYPMWAIKVPGTIDIQVRFIKSFEYQDVLNRLKELNIDVVSKDLIKFQILTLRIGLNRVNELVSQPFIEYVQPALPAPQPLNYKSRSASGSNYLNASIANGGKGLNGEGVTVGIGDNADVFNSIDFNGRLIDRSYQGTGTLHGYHTTGTLAGAGNLEELYRGYAPKATIVSQSYDGIISNAATYVNDYGMVVTNNSYGLIIGCDYNGTYDLYSAYLDQMAYDLPYLENIFAGGNSGGSTCSPYALGYHTVLGGYQSAKNIITVGATTDTEALASFSSRGPVKDGRIKPEIMAVGQMVLSDGPGNFYWASNGTSMACPGVTGGAALLYQRYRQLYGNANPKNVLIKSFLINGATDKGVNGPDFNFGFGCLNLLRSIDMLENHHYVNGNSTNGATDSYTITVPANTAQLKVLLCWNDPPASPLSSRALVNDLDLDVADPSATISLPQILDTTGSNLNNPSITGADHSNNLEQVVINHPVAGTYTVHVKGTAITQNPSQEYVVAYDPVPYQLKLTSPAGGEGWAPNSDQLKITWDAFGYTGTVSLDYSIDNGATWNLIASGIDINQHVYTWNVPNASTNKALVRVTKDATGETDQSNSFTILGKPVVTLSATQCEGYIAIKWNTIPGATDYEMMMLTGDSMATVATTTDTTFTFSGLSKDSTYWVTVRARINGSPGRRAYAISRQPNSGTCSGSISDNDLKLDAILSPITGRKFTASELGLVNISVRVKNLDDAPVTGYTLQYSVNGSTWVNESDGSTIAAGGTAIHTFSTPFDFSSPGTYVIKAVVKNNAGDPVPANDTLVVAVKHLENQPIDLSTDFKDNMETADTGSYTGHQSGIGVLDRYDFTTSTSYGRIRTFVNSGIAFSASPALTIDESHYNTGTVNYLLGTFNLNTYNVNSDDIRLNFEYLSHGDMSNSYDSVWIRGNEAQPWIPIYNLYSNQAASGAYQKTTSLEVSHILAAAGQSFTPSFQIRWGQYGNYPATDRFSASGYTFDDIHLYEVFNDCQLVSVDGPNHSSCALSAATPIVVTVRNSSSNTLTNVPVKYQVDNGAWVSETISTLPASSNFQYTFSAGADLSAIGDHTIRTIVDYSTDTYRENDTATISVTNSPLVASFPYLENFESGTGGWMSSGTNSSWEYGTPASSKINGAASGVKAWKTRLSGNYNDNEYSYLNSPCFNVSGLTHPALSFSTALDLEDCGSTLCDGAWVEYSTDGKTWTKLGTNGAGTNWYNKAGDDVWSIQNYTHWHVSTIPLPTGATSLRLRFVFHSDPATNYEGIAVDDIHIYEDTAGIYSGSSMNGPVTLKVSGNNWFDFERNGQLIASIQPNGQNMDSTRVQAFINNSSVRYVPESQQYYHDRNITIKPVNRTLSDSVTVRFYFLDSEMEALLNATSCATCTKPASAYKMGVSKYSDTDTSTENSSIADNKNGTWSFLPSNKLTIVPYDKGYYAQFKVKDFSEFWLNNGGMNNATPLPVKLLDFTATRNGDQVLLMWNIINEPTTSAYEVEVAVGNEALQNNQFRVIQSVIPVKSGGAIQNYQVADDEPGKAGVRYYRLKVVDTDGSFTYSKVLSVVFDGNKAWQVFPNPSDGHFELIYQAADKAMVTAKIYDAKGSLVKEIHSLATGFLQKIIIDLSARQYASGVYLLDVQTGGIRQGYKLFKK